MKENGRGAETQRKGSVLSFTFRKRRASPGVGEV